MILDEIGMENMPRTEEYKSGEERLGKPTSQPSRIRRRRCWELGTINLRELELLNEIGMEKMLRIGWQVRSAYESSLGVAVCGFLEDLVKIENEKFWVSN